MTYEPFEIVGVDRPSHVVCLCDHASNHVPDELPPRLGLSDADINRHIAYDVGAAGVTRALAGHLNGPAILSNFSRLVIDPNRGEDDPTLLMRLYDGSIIPANRNADTAERERRLDRYYHPYHDAVTRTLARIDQPVLVSVHSFSPQLTARAPRPWHIAILYAEDRRIADPLLARLQGETDLVAGDNEPYHGKLGGDSMDRHGLQHNRAHVLIELRNDLISTETDQLAWAARLAPLLADAIAEAGF